MVTETLGRLLTLQLAWGEGSMEGHWRVGQVLAWGEAKGSGNRQCL